MDYDDRVKNLKRQDKPLIPYSLRIGREWCHIIQNNQQPVCLECSELGHTRRNCPKIRCSVCKRLGHMSHNCVEREEQDGDEHDDAQPDINLQQPEATESQPRATVADDTANENNNANNDPVNRVILSKGRDGVRKPQSKLKETACHRL